jgi:hypothetical protein
MNPTRSNYSVNITVCFLLFAFSLNSLFSNPIAAHARNSNVKTETINPPSTSEREHAKQARVTQSYGKLPLSFEVNEGQVDKQVSFLSRGSGYELFLTSNEAVLSLNVPAAQERGTESSTLPITGYKNAQADLPSHTKHDILRMKLVGADPSTRVTGLEELPGKSNYFLGNDRKQWRTNVAHYARVKYEAIYRGVDLIYYGKQQQLEYDFIVAPGAEPSEIKQVFEGTQSVEIDAEGDLVLRTREGEVRQRQPFIYQEIDGQKRQVAGGYVKTGKRQVGFEVGEYDPNLPLVIDPVLIYSSFLGGSGTEDAVKVIGIDGGGSAYVAGYTTSLNFPTTPGAFQPTAPTIWDAFVSKFDPTGSVLIYSTYLGGSGSEPLYGLAVDSAGSAYLSGYTTSLNFPTTPGVFDPVPDSAVDAFVVKLSPSGSSLVYSTFLGGSGYDAAFGLAVDGVGNAYVTGATKSLNFPTTAGVVDVTFNSTSTNNEDAFAVKLNATGSALTYSTYLGGSNRDIGTGIVVDILGNAYLVGSTLSPDFPRTFGAFDITQNGSFDIFVLKLNSIASGFYYSTFVGGTVDDLGNGIAIDPAGYAYVTGYTLSSNFPATATAFDRVLSGPWDAFVTKLNQSGTGLSYSTFLGGTGVDIGLGIAVDNTGQAYVTGNNYSPNFPTTPGAYDTSHNGSADVFVTKINAAGTGLLYSTFFGHSADDSGNCIVTDGAGNVYVGGSTKSSNFPTTPGAFSTSYNGGFVDGFVAKFQF